MAASGAEPWQTRVSPPCWQPRPRRQPLNATAVAAISLANIWHPTQISPVHTGFMCIPEGLRPGLVWPMCTWMDASMNDLDGWIRGCGIPQGQSGVLLLRESTLLWLLSLGWCLRAKEMNGVVLIHHFLGRLPVCVAHVSGLGWMGCFILCLFVHINYFVCVCFISEVYIGTPHKDFNLYF